MKSTESRITKLESQTAQQDYPYVIHVSDPPTAAERAAMARNSAAGKWFMVVPHKCETVEEWLAKYAPGGL
jgi:hypothetical protein